MTPDGPCGSGECWHAVNGRQCPDDPWPDADDYEPADPPTFPTDPPF